MAAPPKTRRWTWRSQEFRGVIYQVLALLLLAAAGAYLLHNTLENMRARGIQSGFDFFSQPAGFAIGESIVPFDSSESYAKAYAVGLSNTLRVALVGIVGATILGTLVGIGRLSRNLLVRSLCGAYVEATRNVPLLLQLFMWYFALTEFLPPIEEALRPLPGFFFSKNGLQFALPLWEPGHWGTLAGLCRRDGVALVVVIPLQTVDPHELGGVRLPRLAHEVQQRERDRDHDAGAVRAVPAMHEHWLSCPRQHLERGDDVVRQACQLVRRNGRGVRRIVGGGRGLGHGIGHPNILRAEIRASARTSTSARVLYMAKEARQVAVTPKRCSSGWVQWVPARTATPARSITVATSWACAPSMLKETMEAPPARISSMAAST